MNSTYSPLLPPYIHSVIWTWAIAGAASASVLEVIGQRGRVVSWAIALGTLTALLIAAVIAIMFIGAFFGVDASVPVALLFIAAMLSMIAGLARFLREVHLALSTLRFTGATFHELSRSKDEEKHDTRD